MTFFQHSQASCRKALVLQNTESPKRRQELPTLKHLAEIFPKTNPQPGIHRPGRRQEGARQRRHYNQSGVRHDESKLQEPERGKQTKEESKEQEQASKAEAKEIRKPKASRWTAASFNSKRQGRKSNVQEQGGKRAARQKYDSTQH